MVVSEVGRVGMGCVAWERHIDPRLGLMRKTSPQDGPGTATWLILSRLVRYLSIKVPYFSHSRHKNEKVTNYLWLCGALRRLLARAPLRKPAIVARRTRVSLRMIAAHYRVANALDATELRGGCWTKRRCVDPDERHDAANVCAALGCFLDAEQRITVRWAASGGREQRVHGRCGARRVQLDREVSVGDQVLLPVRKPLRQLDRNRGGRSGLYVDAGPVEHQRGAVGDGAADDCTW
eukprot:SAG31_NODE_6329_length_2064_cov_1.551654_3_plen_236_part_00